MSRSDRRKTWQTATLVGALATGLACSFSYSSGSLSDSSKSSSDSVSNSSRSSSGSSSPEEKQQARYEQDVADYTEAYVVSGGSDGGFLRGVGDIAEKRGVSDWEADTVTWQGIGRGLARVNPSAVQLEVYKSNWTGGDAAKMQSLEKGYASER
jgi:hypothetical protein